jgi:hypothetical protein
MGRCTGTPTSTFGGGGGTKLFCSQALSATHANMTKKLRDTATAFCECEGVIPVPQSRLVLEKYRFGRKFSPSMNTNNPLAVKPETENDAGHQKFSLSPVLKFHFDCSGGSSDNDKDFLK